MKIYIRVRKTYRTGAVAENSNDTCPVSDSNNIPKPFADLF